MVTYIYFVKCPNCEDEHFDFFDEAKEFALGCLSQKPIITQTEVCRNDFGECTDSADLGTVWSWEEVMKDTEAAPTESVFTKDDLKHMADGKDPEFDNLDNSLDFDTIEDAINFLVKDEEEAITGYGKVEDAINTFEVENKKAVLDTLEHIKAEEEEHIDELEALLNLDETELVKTTLERKPIPEGMTIEQLVEEMEENEDEVECTLCQDLFDKAQCKKELNLGWLCDRCASGLIARGEQPVFKENTYWDFLDEKLDIDFSNCVDSSDMEIWGLEHVQEDIYKAVPLKRFENVNYRSQEDEYQKVVDEMYDIDGAFTFSFGKNGLPELGSWNVNLLRKLGSIRIDFEDNRYENAVAKVFNRKTLKEEISLTDLVKDSINHLVNDLGKDPLADDFADDVIGDLERNYDTEVPEDFTKYQEWCSAVASEVSRQVNNPDNLTEASLSDIAAAANSEFGSDWNYDDLLDFAGVEDDYRRDNGHSGMTPSEKAEYDREQAKERAYKNKLSAWNRYKQSKTEDIDPDVVHDLGDEYDGAYPDKKPDLPETDEVSDFKLTVCPECGEEAFDAETGICIACGFN